MPERRILPRGVYRCPWLDKETGRRPLIAIGSDGCPVGGPVRLFSNDDRKATARALWRTLDQLDPPAKEAAA